MMSYLLYFLVPRPVSPMAVLTSTNTITVSWSAPTGMTCPPIDDYIVVYNNGSGNMTALTTGLALTLPNLQHGTTYSLFVAARSEGVSGVSVATSPPTITTLLAGMYVDCATVCSSFNRKYTIKNWLFISMGNYVTYL